jgi:hypothetical protein
VHRVRRRSLVGGNVLDAGAPRCRTSCQRGTTRPSGCGWLDHVAIHEHPPRTTARWTPGRARAPSRRASRVVDPRGTAQDAARDRLDGAATGANAKGTMKAEPVVQSSASRIPTA